MAQPSKDLHRVVNIPASQLKALLGTSDKMMRSILLDDRQRTLDTVTRQIQKMLKAESCAIFVVPDSPRDVLVMESLYTDQLKEKCDSHGACIKVQSVEGKGLTGHIADKGEIANMTIARMQASKYWAKTPPGHLKSGICFSLLAIPLKDRKGRLLGLLKAENKQGPQGISNEASAFTDVDEYIARILANKVVVVLENLRAHDVLSGLIKDTQSGKNYNVVLEKILQRAVNFMKADRGDLALWSEQKNDLIIAAVSGETTNVVAQPGNPVPSPSIMRSAWKKIPHPSTVFRKLRQRKDYYESNPRTQSEAAIRLEVEGRPIGVLNLESFYANGFDKNDLETAQLLANYVSIAVKMASKQTSFHGTSLRTISEIPHIVNTDWLDKRSSRLIFAALQAAGFERACIFKYDPENKIFTCMGSFEPGSEDSMRGKSGRIDKNPYNKDMVDTYLNNKRARIYDPTNPLSFGEDPNAVDFGKPKDLPWAAAPLIVDNDLCGQITADNRSTRKPITEESLERLNLIAVQISRSLTHVRTSQLATLMESAPDHIYFKDLDGKFLQISSSMSKYFGLNNPNEAVGKSDFDFFDLTYANRKCDDELRIIQTGKPIKDYDEPDVFHIGCDSKWMSTTKWPLRTAEGNIIGTFGISRDITHRKIQQLTLEKMTKELSESEEALRKANRRLDLQLERASKIGHLGFWEWDIYHAGKHVNVKATDEVYRIFGFTPQQERVRFTDFRMVVHPDDLHIWDEIFSLEKILGKPFSPLEIRLQFSDGTTKYLYAKSEVGKVDDDGLPATIIGLVQDVTERKNLEIRAKGLELAIRGFHHMIPGIADEAASALEYAGDGDDLEAAIAKSLCFFFMVRHKAAEVKSLFYEKSRFGAYTLDEIWHKAWPIALDLSTTNCDDLNILYGNGTDEAMQVCGAFYTAAVNIFANSRNHGTPPFVVWTVTHAGKFEAVFADGGPNSTKGNLNNEGVGLALVKRILAIANGKCERLMRDELFMRYTDVPIPLQQCHTFFRVELSA